MIDARKLLLEEQAKRMAGDHAGANILRQAFREISTARAKIKRVLENSNMCQ